MTNKMFKKHIFLSNKINLVVLIIIHIRNFNNLFKRKIFINNLVDKMLDSSWLKLV